jgi:hypothetical protein
MKKNLLKNTIMKPEFNELKKKSRLFKKNADNFYKKFGYDLWSFIGMYAINRSRRVRFLYFSRREKQSELNPFFYLKYKIGL